MKKIGILFGMETTFPPAFIERVNQKAKARGLNVMAEAVTIDKVIQGDPTEYAVMIDRISQDVPFYRAYVKNAAISGTAVINNPFWFSADEKFFNNALAVKIGVPVPNTVLLPSKERPTDTQETSFRNLKFPLDWEGIFKYVGFPAYMKPHSGGGWKSVYKVKDMEDLWPKYGETDQLVMMLQSEVVFDDYFRCYCLGGKRVHIMGYEPRNPHHLRYVTNRPPAAKKLLDTVEEMVIRLNKALGYDFNTVEFAVQDGIPYAIDFCNPAPDADVNSVGQENFDWIVDNAAEMAIERAFAHKDGQMNLTWGSFVRNSVLGLPIADVYGNGKTPEPIQSTSKETATKTTAKAKETTSTTTSKTAAKASPAAKPTAPAKTEQIAKPAAKATEKSAAPQKTTKADDLKIIEGIGPKIEELLHKAGIKTFDALAKSKATDVKAILEAAGSRYKMHDPSTWAKQATLAAKGEWEKLEKLKAELDGGKKK